DYPHARGEVSRSSSPFSGLDCGAVEPQLEGAKFDALIFLLRELRAERFLQERSAIATALEGLVVGLLKEGRGALPILLPKPFLAPVAHGFPGITFPAVCGVPEAVDVQRGGDRLCCFGYSHAAFLQALQRSHRLGLLLGAQHAAMVLSEVVGGVAQQRTWTPVMDLEQMVQKELQGGGPYRNRVAH